jgi:hypothetical protein
MSDQEPAKPRGPKPLVVEFPAHLLTVLMVLVGVILLLPGLCSLVFSIVWLRGMVFDAVYHPGDFDGAALLITLACAAIGATGAGIIVFAIPRRSSWVSALLVLIGIILLLPGLCSLILYAIVLGSGRLGGDSGFLLLLVFGLLSVGAGGLALIVSAIRLYRSRPAVQ